MGVGGGWGGVCVFFFFKQKTAYEMCGRDWSSDVCSSDLHVSVIVGVFDSESGDVPSGGRPTTLI